MEEKKITITREQLVKAFAKASATVTIKMEEKSKGAMGSIMVVLIGSLLNSEVCSILFDENGTEDKPAGDAE